MKFLSACLFVLVMLFLTVTPAPACDVVAFTPAVTVATVPTFAVATPFVSTTFVATPVIVQNHAVVQKQVAVKAVAVNPVRVNSAAASAGVAAVSAGGSRGVSRAVSVRGPFGGSFSRAVTR